MIANETKTQNRFADTPRDKPIAERTEHANLERPQSQAHPRAARSWDHDLRAPSGWQTA